MMNLNIYADVLIFGLVFLMNLYLTENQIGIWDVLNVHYSSGQWMINHTCNHRARQPIGVA